MFYRILFTLLFLALSRQPSRAANQLVFSSEGVFFGGDDQGTGAYLGVDINEVTQERLSALKLKEERGVEVLVVDQDSPAGKAGLKPQDVILSINGTNIESGPQLRRLIRETPPGRTVTLAISRDGQAQTFKVELGDRTKAWSWKGTEHAWGVEMPKVTVMPSLPEMEFPGSVVVVHSSMRSGLMVENLTAQLGEFFGVKSGRGVLVRSVDKGSRADQAGMRAGDVIVRIDAEKIDDTSDFSRALRTLKAGKSSIALVRDKREQTLTITLPERKQSMLGVPEGDLAMLQEDVTSALSDAREAMEEWTGPPLQQALNEYRKTWDQKSTQWRSGEFQRQMKALEKEWNEKTLPELQKKLNELQWRSCDYI
jgi:membrane-associated protease RseP (regulator of RpoE activity)